MSSQPNHANDNSSSDSRYPDELLDHEYDGIREYDNPMPKWWLWIFYVTIAWSVIYVAGISLGLLPTYEDNLAEQQAELEEIRIAHGGTVAEVDAQTVIDATEDDEMLAQGEEVFQADCAACHGQMGEGLVGPNLTDDHWLNGGAPVEIFNTVRDGVPANGMPAWDGSLSEDELLAVTAYVRSLRGTDPPGAKDPEGELYEGE